MFVGHALEPGHSGFFPELTEGADAQRAVVLPAVDIDIGKHYVVAEDNRQDQEVVVTGSVAQVEQDCAVKTRKQAGQNPELRGHDKFEEDWYALAR